MPNGHIEDEAVPEPAAAEEGPEMLAAADLAAVAHMAVNEKVWVSTSLTGEDDAPHAMVLRKIVAVEDRSIKVEGANGTVSEFFGAHRAYKELGALGVLVLTIGDFATEAATLEPLRKTVLQYLRLLLPDDMLLGVMVRGEAELRAAWGRYEATRRYIVLIGHGSGEGLAFGAEGDDLPGDEVAALLKPAREEEKKVFVSLACQTGTAPFARSFSQAPHCEALIAPMQSIHAAVAALFCHAFFGAHFLDFRSLKVAFNKSVMTPGAQRGTFRFWRNGEWDRGPAA